MTPEEELAAAFKLWFANTKDSQLLDIINNPDYDATIVWKAEEYLLLRCINSFIDLKDKEKLAAFYWIAHELILPLKIGNDQVALINSKSVGPASVSYQQDTMHRGFNDAYYKKTIYGEKYLQITSVYGFKIEAV